MYQLRTKSTVNMKDVRVNFRYEYFYFIAIGFISLKKALD